MSHCYPIDRFTPPGQIPDASHPGWRNGGFSILQDGGKPAPNPSPRREGDHPEVGRPDPYDDIRPLSHPAGRGWQPLSRQRLPGDPPEPSSVDAFAALLDEADSPQAVFTRALQVRFLNRLATCGNVRSACAVAGVSPHTAYKARRRDAAFARLWDAALLVARPHSEAVLAARALDGVEVPVMCRGEVVAYRRHYDGRLLLAHLARLDRAAEQASASAREAAERFDELLALHGGAEPDATLYEPRYADGDGCAAGGESDLPCTLEELVRHARGQALDDVASDEATESEALAQADEEAGALWDEWRGAAFAAVDALVAEEQPAEEQEDAEREVPLPVDEVEEGAQDRAEGWRTKVQDRVTPSPPCERADVPLTRRSGEVPLGNNNNEREKTCSI